MTHLKVRAFWLAKIFLGACPRGVCRLGVALTRGMYWLLEEEEPLCKSGYKIIFDFELEFKY
jgi:hypothetical protein